MHITELATGERLSVAIDLVVAADWRHLTKASFFFDWKQEKANVLWKLTLLNDSQILGVMSLVDHPAESRIEIHLIASQRQQVGSKKIYGHIAGCLIAWACRLAVQSYAGLACVSLLSKTELKTHYMNAYGMMDAGRQLFLEGTPLFKLLDQYLDD